MTDTTDQLALTSAFMRPYIALARKHEYYKLVPDQNGGRARRRPRIS